MKLNFKFAAAALAIATPFSATAAEPISYSKDIAPIFYEKCLSCHRDGEIAPFSMEDYATIRPWAKSIRKAVADKSMPPWHADSTQTKFANDRSLSDEEIELVLSWVDKGAKQGNPKQLPEPPKFHDTWAMGEPDHVFHAERDFDVPALEQEIDYQSIWFNNDLEQDIYVSEWEIRPTERGSVHHANLAHQPKRTRSVGITQAVMSGGAYIGSYLPGARPFNYPEGTALKIPKDSHIGIQVHYVGQEEAVTDHMRFGVKFAKGRVDQLIRTIGTYHTKFDIAPGQRDYAVDTEATLLYPVSILSSGIHMHLRGYAYRASVKLPDGTEKLVTDVPRYDFNWQSNYQLAEPIHVPKGSTYKVRAVWDNSDQNPTVPDPGINVVYGEWTDNEMLNSWSHVVVTDEKLGFKIENGVIADTFADAKPGVKTNMVQGLPITTSAPPVSSTTDSD